MAPPTAAEVYAERRADALALLDGVRAQALGRAGRPAGDFEAGEAVAPGKFEHLFQGEVRQDGDQIQSVGGGGAAGGGENCHQITSPVG